MEKVLLVSNTLGKWGETNGVEYTYNNLIPQFSKRGIEVDALTYGLEDGCEERGSVRITTHRPRIPYRYDKELRLDFNPLFWFGRTGRKFSARDYTLIHSATPDGLGIFAWHVARKLRVPRVSVYHTVVDDFANARMRKLYGAAAGNAAGRAVWEFMKWYYNGSDLILAPSRHIRDYLSPRVKPRVEVLTRGIETEAFSPKRRTRRDERIQILYVGRVAVEKNLAMLMDVERMLQEYRTRDNRGELDFYFTIVGDGTYLDELKRRFPQAEYTGKLTGEPLWRAFANGDIFVFPSRTDTFGNVVMQAMSSGLSVVVTDSMGPKEQVTEGETGFIASSTEDFARAVYRLLISKDERRKMGAAARLYAEEHTWDSIFECLLAQYERARAFFRERYGLC